MVVEKDKGILVIDIKYLSNEYKSSSSEKVRKKLEKIYKVKVLLIDSSTVNTHSASNNVLPAYRI